MQDLRIKLWYLLEAVVSVFPNKRNSLHNISKFHGNRYCFLLKMEPVGRGHRLPLGPRHRLGGDEV